MPKHLYILLVATFIFGFVIGSISYIFMSTKQEDDDTPKDTTRGIEIVVRTYGECEKMDDTRGCPVYRIDNSGEYTHVYLNEMDDVIQNHGKLSLTQMRNIRRMVQNIENTSFKSFTGICTTVSDGVAFIYEITSNGVEHHFDSCVDDLSGEEFFDLLHEYSTSFDVERDST